MYNLSENEAMEEYLSELIAHGALRLDGWEGDSPTFAVVEDKMREVAPEFWEVFVDDANRQTENVTISLFEKGMLDLDIQDDGSVEWSVTDEGYEHLANQPAGI